MYCIGEFSRITGLTVKTLRHYHSIGLLEPNHVDSGSGYRFYTPTNVEKARAIQYLKGLTFSLEEIAWVLQDCREDADVIDVLLNKRSDLLKKALHLKDLSKEIDRFVKAEKASRAMSNRSSFEVEEKTVGFLLVASLRWKGAYSESGKAFGSLGQAGDRFICGPAMNLYYDDEYKETDADIESCYPIRKETGLKGVEVKALPGGKCISLIHQGPYDQLSRSYEKGMKYLKAKRLITCPPIREIYIKGPGMIFKGNPKKYLTEIQYFIGD